MAIVFMLFSCALTMYIWFPHDTPKPRGSEPVGRSLNSGNSAIQHVRVHHCCFHVLVAKQFLDGSDIIPVLRQMCRKRMADGMRTLMRATPASRVFSLSGVS